MVGIKLGSKLINFCCADGCRLAPSIQQGILVHQVQKTPNSRSDESFELNNLSRIGFPSRGDYFSPVWLLFLPLSMSCRCL